MLNKITDITGTKVGHFTLKNEDQQTGMTVLIPSDRNLFKEPLVAAVHVINGFGKSAGLMQIEELGQLETPILLTNTLQVGKGIDAMIQLCIAEYDPDLTSINPVVMECNDGYLNAIQDRPMGYEALRHAFDHAAEDFEQGAIGAGRGMICFKYKGGIGSASTVISHESADYILGALVLTNFGKRGDFLRQGVPHVLDPEEDKGSCIIILGTDAPLDSRQLKRVAKRGVAGLARLGGQIGHGSGEVVLAYSTAHPVNKSSHQVETIGRFPEHQLDLFFRAAITCVENSVLNSMAFAETVTGQKDRTIEKCEFL